MYSNQTQNYGLPQWRDSDKPTWLGDMNSAFSNIDSNLKRIEDKADEGGVPQSIIDRIEALETSVTNIVAKIGTDVIDTIGTSITNAIVNLKSAIDSATTSISNIATQITQITTKIGTDVIDTIGTSITNAIVNLQSAIDTITTKIGNTDISDVGNTITQAIRNIADSGGGVPQSIIDRIEALETSVTNIVAKIGTDVIDTIGTSITNAIVNLQSAIDSATTSISNIATQITQITTKIGTDVIDTIGTSITNAIVNLKSAIDSATTSISNIATKIGNTDISDMGNTITQAIRKLADTNNPDITIGAEFKTNKRLNGKDVYAQLIKRDNIPVSQAETTIVINSSLNTDTIDEILSITGYATINQNQKTFIPYVSSTSSLGLFISQAGIILQAKWGNNYTFENAKVYIEYTKK